MKTKNLFRTLVAAIFVSTMFVACETESDTTDQISDQITSEQVAEYATILSLLDSDVDETTDEVSTKSTSDDKGRCFEVVIHENEDGEFWPRNWTVTYPEEGCVDFRGNVRTGAIDVLLTDMWKNEGASRTITYNAFSFNEKTYTGQRNVTNTGINENGNLTFTRSLQNGSITDAEGLELTWQCNKNVEMIAGQESFPLQDDEYLVVGEASGNGFDGLDFSMNIDEALHYIGTCFFPISGVVTISVEGQSDVVIDYGDGTCDDVATSTVDGVTTEIQLGRPE